MGDVAGLESRPGTPKSLCALDFALRRSGAIFSKTKDYTLARCYRSRRLSNQDAEGKGRLLVCKALSMPDAES